MKNFKKGFIAFLSFILIGFLCNILAFLIPNSMIHQNIMESSHVLQQEGPFFPVIGEKYRNSIADNNTDALMLLMEDFSGEYNIVEKGLGGFYKTYNNTSNTGAYFFDMYISSMQENAEETVTYSYSRYWHGWLLPLRLLLIFFSYEDIRVLSMAVLLLLLIYSSHILYNKNLKFYAIAYIASCLFILPVTASISFEYAFIYYIILIHNIFMMKHYDFIIQKLGFGVYFLILGCCVSYFDFLTYPIASLGFCMTTYLLLSICTEKRYYFITYIKDVILYSLAWGVGYLGMWISKWIIGGIFLGNTVWQDALNQVAIRTSSTSSLGELNTEDKISYIDTLVNNLSVFHTKGYLTIAILFFLFFLYWFLKSNGFKALKYHWKFSLPFMLIFAMPFAWTIIFKNHLYIHYNFTSNIFVVSILAILGFLSLILSIDTEIRIK